MLEEKLNFWRSFYLLFSYSRGIFFPSSSRFFFRCFYSHIQERCKYGKTGWNDNYDFNEFDYEAAAWALSSFTQNASHSFGSSFQWDDLKYFIAEVRSWQTIFFLSSSCVS